MYDINYFVRDLLDRIELTVSGFWSGVGNPFYGLRLWVLDTIAIWRTW